MSFPKLSWGREKHDLVDRWPKGPDGTPEKPAFLADSTEEDNAAGMTVEMLRAYGIPVMKKYDDKDGTLGKVLFGTPSGGGGRYVPGSMREDGRNRLAPAPAATRNQEATSGLTH